jgi:hypothetical protein
MEQLRTIVAAEPEGPYLADAVHPDLARWMADSLEDISHYTSSPRFQRMYAELRAMPPAEQASFVRSVLLDPRELSRRDLTPPDGIRIQRSEFADQRFTSFCVAKRLPHGARWQRVTITF